MISRRAFLASLLVSVAAVQSKAPPDIPPVSYSCPMHAEVVDDKPGACPICGMKMQPVRLAFVWTCRRDPDYTAFQAGKCPKDRTDLVRVTKSLTFTCPVHKKVDELNPGKCPICKRTLVSRYSIRPHGDHNPKHGGAFFMASNNWHIEVTPPAEATFRLYVYDEYSKPFTPPGLAARIVEISGPNGGKKEVSIPFARVRRGGDYLEAKVPGLREQATIAAKVRFEKDDKEYRFDFIFVDYSREPDAAIRKG